jgi:hypothetical protein
MAADKACATCDKDALARVIFPFGFVLAVHHRPTA